MFICAICAICVNTHTRGGGGGGPRAWTYLDTFICAIIKMSRGNTCSNKIKIGCGYRRKRHSVACARMRFASDSTRLLLLAPKRKRSPSVGLLAFFSPYVSPLSSRKALQFYSSRTRDAAWFTLHVNFVSTLDVSD